MPQTSFALSLQASDGLSGPRSLGGALAVFADPTGGLTIDDVASASFVGQFRPIPAMLTEGYRKGAVWVRFSLSAPAAPDQWLLQIERPLIEQVTLYVPDGTGNYRTSPPGRVHAGAGPGIDAYPTIFPIAVPPSETDYYVRLQSSTSMTTSLNMWQSRGYAEYRRLDDWIMAMVVGAVIVMIFTNLLYAAWLRDSLYVVYTGLLVVSSLISLFHMGYASEVLQFWNPGTIHRSWGIIVCLYSIVMMFFLDRLFEFRRNWVWAARFSQLVILLNAGALVFAIIGRYGDVGFFVSRLQQLSLVFIAVFVLYLLVVRRRYQYTLSAIAFLGVISVLLVMQLMYTGANPFLLDGSLSRLLAGGMVIHLILLSAAVARRTQFAERALSQEKDRAIAASRSTEEQLAQRVSERTAELAESNASLKAEMDHRQLLEAKLRQSLDSVNEALAQQRGFVALVSHEFRAPLAVIGAAADNLSLAPGESVANVSLRASRIRQTVKRMSMLIENVLTEERLGAGRDSFAAAEPFDLAELLRTARLGLADDSAARIHIVGDDEARVTGDASLLEIVVLNLVHNALKYSGAGSPVTVRLAADRAMTRVDVVDQGPGVAADDRELIFMRYYRAAGHKVGGSGLGLYIAREIARQHGGELVLASSGPGGSTFSLSLPSAAPEGAAAATPPQSVDAMAEG